MCIGLFDGTFKMLNANLDSQTMAQVTCFNISTDDNGDIQYGRFQCPFLLKTACKEIIPLSSVQQHVHLVHDCLTGECGFQESNHDAVKEREVIKRHSLNVTHNLTNNRYLFNRFFMSCNLFLNFSATLILETIV